MNGAAANMCETYTATFDDFCRHLIESSTTMGCIGGGTCSTLWMALCRWKERIILRANLSGSDRGKLERG